MSLPFKLTVHTSPQRVPTAIRSRLWGQQARHVGTSFPKVTWWVMLLNKFQHTMLPDSSAETTKFGSDFDQFIAQIFVPTCKAITYHLLLGTGWKLNSQEFNSQKGYESSFFSNVPTGSDPHPISYPKVNGVPTNLTTPILWLGTLSWPLTSI